MANTNHFEHFDVVVDTSDHFFAQAKKKIKRQNQSDQLGSPIEDCFTNARSDVYKRIMKEWKVLAHNLPESIYVRVYENRIDLLRAMIVGAAGTPYHDGLFFFDIAFPPDYPSLPPKVHYRSFGYKINPNLYTSGDVCLSLINTWRGKKNEKWDPSGSTILQLLVSLQGLVLNDMPFFNEAGSEILGRGIFEKKAEAYNETVFILNCKTMMCIIQRPPRNFEGFVASHFRHQACAVLSACNDYVNGRVRIGYYTESDEGDLSRVRVSGKFKESIRVLYPQLFAAFVKCGATLENGAENLKMEKRDGSSKNSSDRKYRVVVRKVIGKIRKIYASTLKTRAKFDINVIRGQAGNASHLHGNTSLQSS
ncbi:putative ubiquitin-conjugating enzyme E2 38 [Abrus precatorius]|uniref:Ubiquitin-conjugating enzyme E2 38 n=1 Tax=Abrus precatorius TaxID=3816 RepID=A0A8B8MJE5_ABRPR|nr:putative ubiquitin-conjugating enzyme E2 38 [Abrus precatorius]